MHSSGCVNFNAKKKRASVLPPIPPTGLSVTHSSRSCERPVCQQCSGSIPKVNKLTHGTERIVSGLPPSRGRREWSVLFGQQSRGLRRVGWVDGRTDGSEQGQTSRQGAAGLENNAIQLNWNHRLIERSPAVHRPRRCPPLWCRRRKGVMTTALLYKKK